jgi:hypothetical protein
MSPDLKECQALALRLPPSERAVLAEHLIASLDSGDDAGSESWDDAEKERSSKPEGGIRSTRRATSPRGLPRAFSSMPVLP